MLGIEAVEYLSLRGNSGVPLAATITPDPGQGSGTLQKKRQKECQSRKMGRSAVTWGHIQQAIAVVNTQWQ